MESDLGMALESEAEAAEALGRAKVEELEAEYLTPALADIEYPLVSIVRRRNSLMKP